MRYGVYPIEGTWTGRKRPAGSARVVVSEEGVRVAAVIDHAWLAWRGLIEVASQDGSAVLRKFADRLVSHYCCDCA